MLPKILLALLGCSIVAAQECEVIPSSKGCGVTAIDEDDEDIFLLIEDDEAKCREFHTQCCWNPKNDPPCNRRKERGLGDKAKKPDFDPPTPDGVRKQKARYLSVAPPDPCEPVVFPFTCSFENARYVSEPPINIPYCVRIPCTLDRYEQIRYDNDPKECAMQPGCYFDSELYEYRYEFGPGYLPGVPVCHLAIRRDVFHVYAQKVVGIWDYWNPYFTECTLNHVAKQLAEGPDGCKLIPLLKAFNFLPKMAGYEGITSRGCALIGACWRPGEGCFYPVKLDDLVVKSGQRFHFNKYEIVYGRPKCQNFDPRTPYSILKSYDTCLRSGCSVDANIVKRYYKHLFDIGNTMTTENHWDYWNMVEAGKIGSYNLEAIIWPYKNEPYKASGPAKPNIPPPPPPGHGPPGGDDLFSEFFNKLKPPTKPSPLSKACGHGFEKDGYRPCPPDYEEEPIRHSPCPYVPQYFPRFPKLKGSFAGCCKINPCYLSKSDIRQMHSGPSYYYTPWSYPTPCSKPCGVGFQKRYRECVSQDKSKCTEPTELEEPCNTLPCGRWGAWGPFSPCKSACGIKTRYRKCQPQGASCSGPNEESLKCSPWC